MVRAAKQKERVHFVGIGGVGMSAIARVLLESGTAVSGSDLSESESTRELRRLGAEVTIGHLPSNVNGAAEIVLSSAIATDNPEVLAARKQGIPVRHRSELLARLIDANDGIAIAGAHGKTTVTAMIAWVLHFCGISPTYLIGGNIPTLGGAQVGKGSWIVAEADESDGSLVNYRPQIAVVTGIEADHLENFNDSVHELEASYARFIGNLKKDGTLIVCADDEDAVKLGRSIVRNDMDVITYGFHRTAVYRATDIVYDRFSTTFHVEAEGESIGTFSLSIPGQHNVQNALAAIAVSRLIGVPPDDIRRELATFKGARRRFEFIADIDDCLIVDDYAHHPSEIRATIQAAKSGGPGRVIAVFQPHRYSRTRHLLHQFAMAFDDADHVLITDIFAPPPEQPIDGVSGARLVQLIQKRLGPGRAMHVPTLYDAVVQAQTMMRPEDLIVTMGAGDIWKVAHALKDKDGLASLLA